MIVVWFFLKFLPTQKKRSTTNTGAFKIITRIMIITAPTSSRHFGRRPSNLTMFSDLWTSHHHSCRVTEIKHNASSEGRKWKNSGEERKKSWSRSSNSQTGRWSTVRTYGTLRLLHRHTSSQRVTHHEEREYRRKIKLCFFSPPPNYFDTDWKKKYNLKCKSFLDARARDAPVDKSPRLISNNVQNPSNGERKKKRAEKDTNHRAMDNRTRQHLKLSRRQRQISFFFGANNLKWHPVFR